MGLLAVVKDQGDAGRRCSISQFPSPGPIFPVPGDSRQITAGQRHPLACATCMGTSVVLSVTRARWVSGMWPHEHCHSLIPM